MPDVDATGTSITEIAETTTFLENSEPYLGLSRMEFGEAITDPAFKAYLGPVQRTLAVRSFALRGVALHAPTMLLFSGGQKLAETRYQVPDDAYDTARIIDPIPIAGDAPVIIGFNMDWWGYYHWIVQCLPAIDWAMRQRGDTAARIALPKLQGWHVELLDLLGYGGVDRIEIDRDRCYALPRVIYSEFLNGSTAFGVSLSAARTFQHLRKRARVPPSPHDAIYVARTDSHRRPMRNEPALIRFLESEGVATVVPGALSVAEQISLFSSARIVIGAHGGGMTNIVFSPDDAAVYELLPSHYPNPCFNRLAQARGLDYWADMFPSDGQGHEHEQSWEVDLEVFKRRLAAIRESIHPRISATGRSPAAPTPASASGELFTFYVGSGHSRPIHKWHHYFDIYEHYLARFRHANPTVLELGVEQGGALEMWRAYFGPACRLFGIADKPNAKQLEDIATGIFVGDLCDREFLRAALREIGRPDVVINDGAHAASQQITAFEELYPSLADDGLYIVEDTHTSLWAGAFQDGPDGQNFLGFAYQRCAELMAWTGNLAHFDLLGTDWNVRLWNDAPEFCRTTKQISFFDSMIVFERGHRAVPRHEQR
jgi:capsular polysaccharide biosynthesis protein